MTNNAPDYEDNLYFPQLKEGENSFKATFDNHFSLKKTEGLDFSELLQNSENVANNVANKNLQHLTNYDILKEYEAHGVPVPSYEEWEQLENWVSFTDNYHALKEKLEIAEYENAELKEVLHIIKRQCELLMPKNGLNPVGDRAVMKMFLNKIDEVIEDE